MESENKDVCLAIIADSEKEADKVVAAAENYAKTLSEKTDAELVGYKSAEEDKIAAEAEDIRMKRAADARMEAKKRTLAAKSEIIGEVYEKAYIKLRSLGEKESLALLERLLEKYAEEGDVVAVGKFRADAESVSRLGVVKKKDLKVEVGDFEGGIVLKNDKFDVDLTFEALVRSVREETETEVSARLFGAKI